MAIRPCSRVACTQPALFTLTFDYAEQLAAIGPLSYTATPHSYDLCTRHAERLTVPQGWTIMRPVALGATASGPASTAAEPV